MAQAKNANDAKNFPKTTSYDFIGKVIIISNVLSFRSSAQRRIVTAGMKTQSMIGNILKKLRMSAIGKVKKGVI